jgi:plastocyanin
MTGRRPQFTAPIAALAAALFAGTVAGSVPHNVTFDRYPSLGSGTMHGGDAYELRFTGRGTYGYRCTFHPGMNGVVSIT